MSVETRATSMAATLLRTFRVAGMVVIVFAVLAIAWRGLDLYERSVLNDSVRLKMEVERHERLMGSFDQARKPSDSADTPSKAEVLKQIEERASQKPDGP